MKREICSDEDIESLEAEWDHTKTLSAYRVIRRIEDIPRVELVNGADIQWIVEGILAQGLIHMITSEPGAGKSTFLSAAASAVSRGEPFMGRATSKSPVLLLDGENPLPAIRDRFSRLRIETHDDFRVWGRFTGEEPPQARDAIVLEWVERCDPKPLIVIDSMISFHAGDENDSNEARRFMDQYQRLVTMGATPALLHHSGKSETSREYRGSSDYKAVIDIGYKLVSLGDGTRLSSLELKPFKQRVSVWPPPRIRYLDGIFSVDQAAPQRSATERLVNLLTESAGITKSAFEKLAAERGIGRNVGRKFLNNGIASGKVRVEPGPQNQKFHFWEAQPAI